MTAKTISDLLRGLSEGWQSEIVGNIMDNKDNKYDCNVNRQLAIGMLLDAKNELLTNPAMAAKDKASAEKNIQEMGAMLSRLKDDVITFGGSPRCPKPAESRQR
jgi:hypothetical protein